MVAVKRNAFTQALFRIHPWIYRKSGGRLLSRLGGVPILLLNTQGRKSRQPRTNGLVYVELGGSWAVAASWAGEPKHPIWYLNLMAQPDVTIQVRVRVVAVRARELEGEQRARAWKMIVDQDEGFAEYEKRTRGVRDIPVIAFDPL